MQFPQVMAAVARIDDGPKMYDEVLLLPPAVVVVVVVVGRMEDGILQRLLDVAAVVLEESLRRWSWRQWELTWSRWRNFLWRLLLLLLFARPSLERSLHHGKRLLEWQCVEVVIVVVVVVYETNRV